MSDFAQAGLITTLQRLNDSHLDAIESELIEASGDRPIGLVLPCHARDLEQPALARIVEELSTAAWLREVVVSMNGPDRAVVDIAEERFARLPQTVRILWNEPADIAGGTDQGATRKSGKGQNVAAAFALLCGEGTCGVIATQDCDVASFRRRDLARLCYAVTHPSMGFQFAKAYYSRATDRLYGRVTRLFFLPLLYACVRVLGHQPLLSFLLSFRYPLSGEIALTRELAGALPLGPGWSLEIATLCELFRHIDPRDVCQVDGGGGYDHKHQPATLALGGMAQEIAGELFRQITRECGPPPQFETAIKQAYQREAELAVRRSGALAQINGLPYDRAAEEALVQTFLGSFRS